MKMKNRFGIAVQIVGSIGNKMEQKFCHKCGRAVRETIHTQTSWSNDYFTKKRGDKEIVTCVDCTELVGKMPS